MKHIEYIYIIPVALTLISFIWLLLQGKKIKDRNKTSVYYLPLISVILVIIGIFSLSYYYKIQLEKKIQQFENLKTIEFVSDSTFLSIEYRKQTIDSLTMLSNELDELLEDIIRKERRIGSNSDIKIEIAHKINSIRTEIELIESYPVDSSQILTTD